MAIYVMGDIHGCFDEFKSLLKKAQFNHKEDQLYLVGDLINRGPKSLDVIQYLMEHEQSIFPVLGNHDLSYLVYAAEKTKLRRGDTYNLLKDSPQSIDIQEYLRKQPLMRYIEEFDVAIAHAGIPPFWSIEEALSLNNEIHELLEESSKESYLTLMAQMFGNHPSAWSDSLEGLDRIRVIINYFTRMRYLHLDLSMDFDNKREEYDPTIMQPWFKFERPLHQSTQVLYGHWASLGIHDENNTLCLDSGCVWGGNLTMLKLDHQSPTLISVPSKKNK